MKTWIKIVLALLLLGVLGAFYVYKFMYNKPHMDVEHAKADYSLKALDLYNEFKNNKDVSGKKYNGKVIEINGTLSKIEQADTLTLAVFVFEQGMFGDQGMRCTLLPDQVEKAKKIAAGTEVKVKGYCTGYNDSDVIIEKSSFVE